MSKAIRYTFVQPTHFELWYLESEDSYEPNSFAVTFELLLVISPPSFNIVQLRIIELHLKTWPQALQAPINLQGYIQRIFESYSNVFLNEFRFETCPHCLRRYKPSSCTAVCFENEAESSHSRHNPSSIPSVTPPSSVVCNLTPRNDIQEFLRRTSLPICGVYTHKVSSWLSE